MSKKNRIKFPVQQRVNIVNYKKVLINRNLVLPQFKPKQMLYWKKILRLLASKSNLQFYTEHYFNILFTKWTKAKNKITRLLHKKYIKLVKLVKLTNQLQPSLQLLDRHPQWPLIKWRKPNNLLALLKYCQESWWPESRHLKLNNINTLWFYLIGENNWATTIFTLQKANNKCHQETSKTLSTFWSRLKAAKKKFKSWQVLEKRRLKWVGIFFKILGFRQNKNRPEQYFKKTKKFKQFALYKKVLGLSTHKKDYQQDESIYPLQSFRTRLTYYKLRWQSMTYFLKTYFPKKFDRSLLSKLAKSRQALKKNQLLDFMSQMELTLGALLLRLQLMATSGMAEQFIRHGHVYVNYKRITHSLYTVKPGDTISVFINPLINMFHRFYDPAYTNRMFSGLYRRNTGRRSPVNFLSSFLKTGLGFFKKIKKNIKFKDLQALDSASKKFLANCNNKIKVAAWKHGFISDTITGHSLRQLSYADNMHKSLI